MDRTTRDRRRKQHGRQRGGVVVVAITAILLLVGLALPAGASEQERGDHRHGENEYRRTDLVSDQAGKAALQDTNLKNAWGMASGPATPLWVSDNGADVTTIYKGAVDGSPLVAQPLVVTIPEGAPTGQVFNTTQDFVLHNGTSSKPALFIFAAESGHITAWNQDVVPATTAKDVASTPDAIYKGITLASTRHGSFLYAANFHAGTVDVFDGSFTPVHQPGAFVDPNLPAGYAPFNVQEIDGTIYVTYAVQQPNKVDDAAGPGHGIVDAYSPEGRLQRRLVSHGDLNSPWGLALAPKDFGRFSGALLIGNFGDGHINAYNPHNGHFLGSMRDDDHHEIVIDGLWGLRFGNGVAGDPTTLFFTAGPNDEANGLLGTLEAEHGRSHH